MYILNTRTYFPSPTGLTFAPKYVQRNILKRVAHLHIHIYYCAFLFHLNNVIFSGVRYIYIYF